jgi:hypothetical protein
MKRSGWGAVLVRAAIVFAFLNLAVWAALKLRWLLPARFRPLGPVAARVGLERLAGAYPELPKERLARFLAERAAANRMEYEAFTECRQVPVRGEFLNVTGEGYRLVKDQGPWPPSREAWNVFVFGGSTAFGDGLPDDETLPSALQELLPQMRGRKVRCYNFARPGYYSTQERILFEQLLLARVHPDAAVFVDGVNEGRAVESPESPRWSGPATERIAALVEEANQHQGLHALGVLARALPVTRVGMRLLARTHMVRPQPLPDQNGVAERWLANRRMTEAVARRFAVPVLFVWQPMPLYKYDVRFHLPGGELPRLAPIARTYETLRRELDASPGDARGVLWLADVQEGRRENLYVDEVHYTARFSRELASAVAKRLAADLASQERQTGLEGGGLGR